MYLIGVFLTIFAIYIALKLRILILNLQVLCKIPGRKSPSILGRTDLMMIEGDELFRITVKDSREFYPIFAYRGFHYFAVCMVSPDDVEAILSSTRHLSKSRIYETVHPWLQMGLLTSKDEKWQTRRKMLTPTFHFNILQQFVPVYVEHSNKLCNEIATLVDQSVDVVPIISKHTLHIICETAMGAKLDSDESEYTNAIHRMGKLAMERIVRPWLIPYILFMLSPIYYETIKTAKYLQHYTVNIIKERQKNFDISQIPQNENDVYKSKKRLAMLDMMLYAKMTGVNIDDRGIGEEVDTFLFEGHDTTSNCVCFTLLLLANHTDIQIKIVQELEEVFPTTQTSITCEILNSMTYLDRVIKESLRLFPSVPVIGRKTTEEMRTPSGYLIPKGTEVILKIYDMHRHPKVYSDPDQFDPDRFLPENVKGRHPYSYIPFSAGPRNCIGQKFAMLEVKTILTSILRRFELVAVDSPDSVVLMSDIVLRCKNGVRIQFRRRSNEI